jgi:predicted small lipoprotein YifL
MKALTFSIAIAAIIGLTGCGNKTPETKHTVSDFEHPSSQLLQDIASKQARLAD